jgi:hypothetical protein
MKDINTLILFTIHINNNNNVIMTLMTTYNIFTVITSNN